MDLKTIEKYARKCYDETNCSYDNQNYYLHINMVVNILTDYISIFRLHADRIPTIGAAHTHDLIEDAKQTFNNIQQVCGKDVADITLAVTDVPAENRLMRHLLTMGKTVKDYRAIILKMCDMHANGSYSELSGSSMFKKYVAEYEYRRPIFKLALKWYKDDLNQDELNKLWDELDAIHGYKKVV